MKGQQAIIDVLNQVLTAELTAVNQYFVHAKMCRNWGYARLANYIKKESIDEMKHADSLIERILYLDGVPNLQRLNKVNVGETVPEQLKLDLEVEREAVARLNDGMKLCRDLGDNGTEDLLRHILVAEEEHADWIESQLTLIEQLGVAHYLAQQVRD
ncbi:MAG: bacterioferritin [Polyangiales bacterium]